MSASSPSPILARRCVAVSACSSLAMLERGGEGAPIVLLHGNSSSGVVFDALLREPALEGRRLVVIDLPGAGHSADGAVPHQDYTIPAVARALIEGLARADIVDPVVLGWSLGGHIAIEMAAQGAMVRALILTGTPPAGPGLEDVSSAFHQDEVFAVGVSENPTPDALQAYLTRVYGCEGRLPAVFSQAGARFDGRFRARFGEHWLSGEGGHDQRRFVAEWERPIAVIQGDREPFFNPHSLDRLPWRHLWRGRSQMIDGAGHAPFVTHPSTYADLVAAFLTDIGA